MFDEEDDDSSDYSGYSQDSDYDSENDSENDSNCYSDAVYGPFPYLSSRDYIIQCIQRRGMVTHYLTQYLIHNFKF